MVYNLPLKLFSTVHYFPKYAGKTMNLNLRLYYLRTTYKAYVTLRFNASITISIQKTLSWAESIQLLVLIPISLIFILMFSSNLRLGIPKGLLPVGLPVKMLKAFLPSYILPTCFAPLKSSRFSHPDYIR